jgi:hypothetical protein
MVLLEPKCVKQLDIQNLIGLYNGFCTPMSIHHAHTTPCKLATLALRFLQPFHTFAETEHVTSISGRESGGLCAGPSMLLAPNKLYPLGFALRFSRKRLAAFLFAYLVTRPRVPYL